MRIALWYLTIVIALVSNTIMIGCRKKEQAGPATQQGAIAELVSAEKALAAAKRTVNCAIDALNEKTKQELENIGFRGKEIQLDEAGDILLPSDTRFLPTEGKSLATVAPGLSVRDGRMVLRRIGYRAIPEAATHTTSAYQYGLIVELEVGDLSVENRRRVSLWQLDSQSRLLSDSDKITIVRNYGGGEVMFAYLDNVHGEKVRAPILVLCSSQEHPNTINSHTFDEGGKIASFVVWSSDADRTEGIEYSRSGQGFKQVRLRRISIR